MNFYLIKSLHDYINNLRVFPWELFILISVQKVYPEFIPSPQNTTINKIFDKLLPIIFHWNGTSFGCLTFCLNIIRSTSTSKFKLTENFVL